MIGYIVAGAGPIYAHLGRKAMGIQVMRTHDMDLVREIVMHPAIWPHVHEDGTDESWQPEDMDGIYWMLARDPEVIGLFMVHHRGAACFEMHTCILPIAWGTRAKIAAEKLLEWAFTEAGCQKMVTNVPAYNRAALRYAKAGGMQQEGINRASYLHAGQMIDQIMLGITKEEWLCQQQSQSQQQ